jgi:hypothetical protein
VAPFGHLDGAIKGVVLHSFVNAAVDLLNGLFRKLSSHARLEAAKYITGLIKTPGYCIGARWMHFYLQHIQILARQAFANTSGQCLAIKQ